MSTIKRKLELSKLKFLFKIFCIVELKSWSGVGKASLGPSFTESNCDRCHSRACLSWSVDIKCEPLCLIHGLPSDDDKTFLFKIWHIQLNGETHKDTEPKRWRCWDGMNYLSLLLWGTDRILCVAWDECVLTSACEVHSAMELFTKIKC